MSDRPGFKVTLQRDVDKDGEESWGYTVTVKAKGYYSAQDALSAAQPVVEASQAPTMYTQGKFFFNSEAPEVSVESGPTIAGESSENTETPNEASDAVEAHGDEPTQGNGVILQFEESDMADANDEDDEDDEDAVVGSEDSPIFCQRCEEPARATNEGLCAKCRADGWRYDEKDDTFTHFPLLSVPAPESNAEAVQA